MEQYSTGNRKAVCPIIGAMYPQTSPIIPPPIPDWVPIQFGIGTTVQFTRQFSNFPSNDPLNPWTYTIYWNGPLDKFSKPAEAVSSNNPGPAFFIWLKPTDTTALHAGCYRYCERLTNPAGDVWDVTGDTLTSNLVYTPADAPAGAFLTPEEQTLAVLQAAITGNKSPLVQSYHIAGRAVSNYSLKDLMALAGNLKSVIWRQQHPGQLGVDYAVRFTLEPTRTRLPDTWVNIVGMG